MEKAIADLNKAIALDPNSPSAYYNRALILLQRGEFDQALADLNEAVRCDPRSADALIVRGLCYVARNNLDQALASFDGAIVTAPFNAMAFMQRSKLYSREGERDKQERDYQQALGLDRYLKAGQTDICDGLATSSGSFGLVNSPPKAKEILTNYFKRQQSPKGWAVTTGQSLHTTRSCR